MFLAFVGARDRNCVNAKPTKKIAIDITPATPSFVLHVLSLATLPIYPGFVPVM